ncbi:MAG: cation transporter, partial [Clostridiales bacterium]|nr:cation transporter [Clostridiales bacterium]
MAERVDRQQKIIRTSIIGIGANILLAAFKALVGLMSNSIAIILDAVNNLSDALSSTITIIGAKIAGKKPDKKHPMGHGRVEYISTAVIALLVLYAGLTSLIESVKKIIWPEVPDYTATTFVIVIVAIAVKIFLSRYVSSVGKKVNSDSLMASGKDAMFDVLISLTTLIAAVVFVLWHISVEAYLGVLISIVIIKSGIEMIREAISRIVGERVNSDLSKSIKAAAAEIPEVRGVYDLLVNNYGPENYIASLHVEVDDTMTADEIDHMTRKIQHNVFKKCGVLIAAVGIYSNNTCDEKAREMKEEVRKIITSHENVIQIHGFYADHGSKIISVDYISDFDAPDPKGEYAKIYDEIKAKYPDYDLRLTL